MPVNGEEPVPQHHVMAKPSKTPCVPRRPLAHGRRAQPGRLAPAGAVARPREPAMRPLSPVDDAARLAQTGWGQPSNEAAPPPSSHSSTGNIGNGARDLVPMQYRGPPQQGAAQHAQVQRQPGQDAARPTSSTGPATSSSSSNDGAARRVAITASTNGAAPVVGASGGTSGGAVLYRQRVPAGTMVQGAAAAGATFQRSMMVAGFEEGEACCFALDDLACCCWLPSSAACFVPAVDDGGEV